MDNQSAYLALINKSLQEIAYPCCAEKLFEPIRYTLALGGKRIRPLLTLMSASVLSDRTSDALPVALGLEVFHNFTLLHDDLMDHAEMRRNQPTVHCKWDENTAILSGDAMQIMAYQLIAKAPSDYLQPILHLFSQTALEICEGQQLDMDFESRYDVSADEYIEMIRLKTAVLLGCALKSGAIIGGLSPKDADLLYSFGEKIGLAFQLKDDWLDVYADSAVFGKKIGGDILNNKKTYLLIVAFSRASSAEQKLMLHAMNDKTFSPEKKIALFTRLYDTTSAKRLCEDKMRFYFKQGLASLAQLSLNEQQTAPFRQLAERLMYRES